MITTSNAYDVVVVGSGGAGLRAGIGASDQGCKTLVISKGKINRSGATLLAGANISADIACDGGSLYKMGLSDVNKDDTKEKWFEDIIHEGFYLNNQDLVEIFVEDAPERISELMSWGMKVSGIEGERGISVFGSDILDALYKKTKECKIDYLEDTIFTDLVQENGIIKGIICLDIINGEVKFIPAKAVVIATGGAHNLFSINSGSTGLCGEGQATALRAGASLIDMEMVSFCPGVTLFPTMYKGNILPYILQTLGYGTMTNKFGKTFTHKYLSKDVEALALETEWNKMLLSYAMQCEINNGKSNMYGGIYFALNNHPTNIYDELYAELPPLKTGIYKDIMEIFETGSALSLLPAAHYFEGGIKIKEDMSTDIKGLYAAGECTGGMFGANRVSAATTEMLVEGAIAGKSAGIYALESELLDATSSTLEAISEEIYNPFAIKNGLNVVDVITKLQNTITNSLSIIRNQDDMVASLKEVDNLINDSLNNISITNSSKQYNREWIDYLKLRNMLLTGQAMLTSAILRKESRGVHIRKDYNITDNKNYLKNVVIKNTNMDYALVDVITKKIDTPREINSYIDEIENVVKKLS